MTSPETTAPRGEPGDRAYRRAFVAFLLVVTVFVALLHVPADDGLRHVGVAFGEDRSWGEVYPYSVFAEHPRYDPWWGFDRALRGAAATLRLLGVPVPVGQTVALKTLALAFLAAFLLLAAGRARLPAKVRSPQSLAAAAVLMAVFLSIPMARILTVRPFVLGSLYLLYALAGTGALRGALAAGLLGACYPYLFWVYTLPVAAAHLARGDRRFGAGTVLLTGFVMALQPRAFWGLLEGLGRSEQIRATLTIKISEIRPLTAEPLLGLSLLFALLCLLPFLPAASRRVGVPHLLMVFFAPAAVRYVRYLIDVEIVLLFVICGGALVDPLAAKLELIGAFWLERARASAARLRSGRHVVAGAAQGGVNLRPAIAIVTVILIALLITLTTRRLREDAQLAQALEAVPKGGLVLTDFNLQYRLLFVRPDLRLVPSCELGFPTEAILPEYRRFFDNGDPCGLARKIGTEWYVGLERLSIAPGAAACLAVKAGQFESRDRPTIVLWRLGPAG